MRTRGRPILVGTIGLVALSAGAQACGDTADVGIGGADAGADAPLADRSTVETGMVVPEAAPPDAAKCDLSSDVLDGVPLDASITADGATAGVCVQCARMRCAADLAKCNQDCGCKNLASAGLACIRENPSNPVLCAAPFLGASPEVRDIGLGLLLCLNLGCPRECAADTFVDAGVRDARVDASDPADAADAADGATDAADAGADADADAP